MIVELLSDLQAWSAIELAWDNLAQARGNLFVSPTWSRSAVEVLTPIAPLVAVVREDDEIVGVMNFAESGRRRPIRFIGSEFGDRFEPACKQGVELAVCEAVGSALRRQREGSPIVLSHVEAAQTWWQGFSTAKSGRVAVLQRESKEPYIDLSGLDWDGYLASRSKSFRKRLRYLERALRRDHEIEIRQAGDPASLERDLDAFFELHDLRWSSRGGSSLNDPRQREFLRALARSLLEAGQLRLRFLEVDGTPVASLFGWRYGHRYCYYQGGFDPAWSKQSVGMLLVADSIRAAIEEGAAEFDFLLGEEPYKRRFTDDSRTVTTAVIVRRRGWSRLSAEVEAWLRRKLAGADHPILSRLSALTPSRRS